MKTSVRFITAFTLFVAMASAGLILGGCVGGDRSAEEFSALLVDSICHVGTPLAGLVGPASP